MYSYSCLCECSLNLSQVGVAGTWFACSRGMEVWIDLSLGGCESIIYKDCIPVQRQVTALFSLFTVQQWWANFKSGHELKSHILWKCTWWAKKLSNLFLWELRQISTKFDNFWHTDSQDYKIMWGTLIVHLNWFISAHYRVKCRCSKLLHNA